MFRHKAGTREEELSEVAELNCGRRVLVETAGEGTFCKRPEMLEGNYRCHHGAENKACANQQLAMPVP
jgi:hypothetical protein